MCIFLYVINYKTIDTAKHQSISGEVILYLISELKCMVQIQSNSNNNKKHYRDAILQG